MRSTITGVVATLALLALGVGGYLALTGSDDAEERRAERKTEQQAGPAGDCSPQGQKKVRTAATAFLDRYLEADNAGWVTGAGPVRVGGGYELQVSTDPAVEQKDQPQCFRGVPVRYLRAGPYGPEGESVE